MLREFAGNGCGGGYQDSGCDRHRNDEVIGGQGRLGTLRAEEIFAWARNKNFRVLERKC